MGFGSIHRFIDFTATDPTPPFYDPHPGKHHLSHRVIKTKPRRHTNGVTIYRCSSGHHIAFLWGSQSRPHKSSQRIIHNRCAPCRRPAIIGKVTPPTPLHPHSNIGHSRHRLASIRSHKTTPTQRDRHKRLGHLHAHPKEAHRSAKRPPLPPLHATQSICANCYAAQAGI